MKDLPTGIQNIEEILSGNFVYVDKTGLAHQLITIGKHYFMSRPRRFGKSLFVSMLEQIFKGNKELFKDCAIYNTSYKWDAHPVLHFDFALIESETPDILKQGLRDTLEDIAGFHGLTISGSSLKSQLTRLVRALVKKENRVVVLVDEYDQPIINNLNNFETAYANRDILRNFFGALKGLDAEIRFTFVTGVSKFTQVSLFSGLNNLNDISFDPRYASMMGYTKDELQTFFSPHIKSLANGTNCCDNDILSELKEWYNGYCFSANCELIYNPFSTLLYFDKKKADGYWFSSGTPSFLIDQIKKHPQAVTSLSGATAFQSSLSDISRLEQIDLVALMFQTGYLTIKEYNDKDKSYHLDFPNREVREAFFDSLLHDFAQMAPTEVAKASGDVQKCLKNCDIKTFVKIMNLHFAKIAYQLFAKSKEGFYHAIFLTFLERSGMKTYAEVATNIGRIDLVTELPEIICIFELKLDKTADVACDQAIAQNYQERYTHTGKNILAIGINFSSESRNISDWKGRLFSSTGELLKDIH